MENSFSKIIRFWNQDRSLATMLLLLLLFIFVLVPAVTPGRGGSILIKFIYSLMLVTAIWSVAKQKKYLYGVIVLAIISLIGNWVSDIEPTRPVLIAYDFSVIFFNLFFALIILIKTFQSGDITFQRIEGSIVAYLLIGLIFAYVFHAIYLIEGPSAFNNIRGADLKEFLYYSFTNLTTMGYGDITPVNSVARSMANLEGLIGQLYPAILIARLVSMEFESSNRKKEKI